MDEQPRRRRRSDPALAKREILDAAARLFVERPAHEVTVRTIMDATTLARPSFYDHFDRRATLIMELVEPIVAANRAVLAQWPEHPDDPRAAAHVVIAELVRAWRQHGRLLAALADAAAVDGDAAAAYHRFSADSVTLVADRIRREQRHGAATDVDPEETALALVLMNRAYLSHRLLAEAPPPDEVLTRALVGIWTRVLWPGR